MDRPSKHVLERCAAHARRETDARKGMIPESELIRRSADVPPPRGFARTLEAGPFGLIAEIKYRSPSKGSMRRENVAQAPGAYEASPVVRAVSILTQEADFGLSVDDFARFRASITKPILRKDFIETEYQIHEARAMGADAVLLMCQLLPQNRMQALHDLATELGLDVLVETRGLHDFGCIPSGARVVGINSRDFMSSGKRYWLARNAKAALQRVGIATPDFTTKLGGFQGIRDLHLDCVKVAESGMGPKNIPQVAELGYHAALVGTGLLLDPRGVDAALEDYGRAMRTVTAGMGSPSARRPSPLAAARV